MVWLSTRIGLVCSDSWESGVPGLVLVRSLPCDPDHPPCGRSPEVWDVVHFPTGVIVVGTRFENPEHLAAWVQRSFRSDWSVDDPRPHHGLYFEYVNAHRALAEKADDRHLSMFRMSKPPVVNGRFAERLLELCDQQEGTRWRSRPT